MHEIILSAHYMNLMASHGHVSIQLRPCAAYMRIMHNCKEGPPEEDAEKGTEGRVFETETRTSLPRDMHAHTSSLAARGKE